MLYRLGIDFENPAKDWWDNGGRELWESVAESPDAAKVLLDESIARSWMEQASQIEGWEGGPEFAPHPVFMREAEEDEIAEG